jgi:hypothetical protein
MKHLLIAISWLLCIVATGLAADMPATRPSSQAVASQPDPSAEKPTSATLPSATASPPTTQDLYKSAINPKTDTWTTAMPDNSCTILAYRSVPVRQTISHNTYPHENFLPNARIPGSEGITTLNRAEYIDFGFRCQKPVNEKLTLNFDATGLFAATGGSNTNASGFNLVDHRAANDTRPRGEADFVYTDTNYGYDLAIGATWSLSKEYYIGAVADFTTVYIDSGWDRYSSFISQTSRQLFIPAGGIKIGYRMSKNSAIEGTFLLGRNGMGYFAGMVWDF